MDRSKVPGDTYVIGELLGASEDDIGRLSLFGIEATVDAQRAHGEARGARALEHEGLDAVGGIQRVVVEDFASFDLKH